ncbi:hypothetical protein [Demequina sp. SO4-18]|uniref:hypothetical protein n=1 Tax=Demequina sp. SO4-18 TaxID=3401026 RepID=UPI003B5CE0C8
MTPRTVTATIVGLTSGAAMAAGAPWYVVLGAWAVLGALGLIVWAMDLRGES